MKEFALQHPIIVFLAFLAVCEVASIWAKAFAYRGKKPGKYDV